MADKTSKLRVQKKATTPAPKPAPKERIAKAKGDSAVMRVTERNDFYRDGHAGNRKVTLLLFAALFLSLLFNGLLFAVQPEVRVVAMDPTGRIIPVRAMSDPIYKDSTLNDWVVDKVVELNTYDFRNWRRHFQAMSENFTDMGWRKYGEALESSKTIELVEKDKMIVTAIRNSAPVITGKGTMQDGRYAWRVEFHIMVTYEGASSRKVQKLKVTARVVRADLLSHENGIAIEQLISKEEK